jgi:hypothetical protein
MGRLWFGSAPGEGLDLSTQDRTERFGHFALAIWEPTDDIKIEPNGSVKKSALVRAPCNRGMFAG